MSLDIQGAILDQIQQAPTYFPRVYGCYGPDTLNYCTQLGQVSVLDENGNVIRFDEHYCVFTSMGGCRILLENNGLVFRTGITHPDKTTPIEMYGGSINFWIRRSTNCAIRLINETGQTRPGYLAEGEPDKSITSLLAAVTCEGVPTDASVKLEAQAEENSGGHRHHDSRRPNGSLGGSPPSENVMTGNTGTGGLAFTFGAPAVSGDYRITAACTDRTCTQEGPRLVWVGVKGLVHIPSAGYWGLIGETSIHPVGWHLTGEALGKLMDLARLYKQVYFPFAGPLQLNDASLERGGVFDIDWAKYDSNGNVTERRAEWWTPPHSEHRRGTVIDILANGTATAIPQNYFAEFHDLMTSLGMTWVPEHLNQSGGHYHVRLLGVAQ